MLFHQLLELVGREDMLLQQLLHLLVLFVLLEAGGQRVHRRPVTIRLALDQSTAVVVVAVAGVRELLVAALHGPAALV